MLKISQTFIVSPSPFFLLGGGVELRLGSFLEANSRPEKVMLRNNCNRGARYGTQPPKKNGLKLPLCDRLRNRSIARPSTMPDDHARRQTKNKNDRGQCRRGSGVRIYITTVEFFQKQSSAIAP